MSYLKSAIFLTMCILIACVGYIYFNFNTNHQKEQILEAYQKGQVKEAQALLDKAKSHLSEDEIGQIQGYLSRDFGDYAAAERSLQEMLEHLAGQVPELELQVHQNRAINSLLQRDLLSLKQTLVRLESMTTQNAYSPFFSGFLAFLEGNYTSASMYFTELIPLSSNDTDPWFSTSFQKHLPPLYRGIFQARAQFSSNLEENRSYLEEALSSHQYSDVCELYLGVSYLIEASRSEYPSSIPYLTLAIRQLEKTPYKHPFLISEKKDILEKIHSQGNLFISKKDFSSLSTLMKLLNEWEEAALMASFADKIIDEAKTLANRKSKEEAFSYARSVEKHLSKSGQFFTLLSNKIEKSLKSQLKEGNTKSLTKLWLVASELTNNPKKLTHNLSQDIKREILSKIQQDGNKLKKTQAMLKMLSYMERDPKQRFLFASQLIAASTGLWVSGKEPEKAHRLMVLAGALPYLDDKPKLLTTISAFLRDAYSYARKNDDANNLPYLIQTIKHYGITVEDVEKPLEIGNQLADAKSLLERERYYEARKKAEWVLHLVPDNEEALTVLGMTSYLEKKYSKAIEALSKVSSLVLDAEEALGISYFFVGNIAKGKSTLERLSNERQLSDFALEQLGITAFLERDYQKAFSLLKTISKPTQDTLGLLCLSSYKNESYSEALYYFEQLAPSIRETPLMLQAVFQSHAAMQQLKEAELYLREAQKNLDMDMSSLPENFKKAYNSLWEHDEFLSQAGSFYQNQMQDPKKALKYFKKMSKPTDSSKLKEAQAYLNLKDHRRATKILNQVSTSKTPQLKRKSLTLSLISQEQQGQSYQALITYKNKVHLEPDKVDLAAKKVIANILYSQEAWKESAALWKELRGISKISIKEELSYIESLYNSGSKTDAKKALHAVKSRAPKLLPKDKIALTWLISQIEGNKQAETFLSRLPSFSVPNNGSVSKLIELYAKLKDFKSAASLSETYEETLKKSPEGLETLIKHFARNGDSKKLHQVLRKLIEKSPEKASCSIPLDLLTRNNEKMALEKALLKNLKKRESHPSIRLVEGTFNFLAHHNSAELLNTIPEMMKFMKRYSSEYPKHAKLARLQAQGHLLLKEYTSARVMANRAISLDPFSTSSYKVLANAHQMNGNKSLALSTLEKASKLPYSHSEQEELALEKDQKSLLR